MITHPARDVLACVLLERIGQLVRTEELVRLADVGHRSFRIDRRKHGECIRQLGYGAMRR
ncbi:hypothetical protein BKA01_001127 [Pseudonocardia eucalypti]|uniref:hypothetical protein n=1 Tax=Pseudonocardia eucalypti TaxID=648755 RepID=UPI0016094420|nr:hypothetical protein [Pseudonocardia eucalypti]